MENIKVISAHGNTINELITIPNNVFIFYLAKFSDSCTEKEHDVTISYLNNWISKFKKLKKVNNSKKILYRDCIMLLLFKDIRDRFLNFLTGFKYISNKISYNFDEYSNPIQEISKISNPPLLNEITLETIVFETDEDIIDNINTIETSVINKENIIQHLLLLKYMLLQLNELSHRFIKFPINKYRIRKKSSVYIYVNLKKYPLSKKKNKNIIIVYDNGTEDFAAILNSKISENTGLQKIKIVLPHIKSKDLDDYLEKRVIIGIKILRNIGQQLYCITKFWNRFGFNQFVSPIDSNGKKSKICNQTVNFLPLYKPSRKQYSLIFFYSGIIPLENLKGKTEYLTYSLEDRVLEKAIKNKTRLSSIINGLSNKDVIERATLFENYDNTKYSFEFTDEEIIQKYLTPGAHIRLQYVNILNKVLSLSPILKNIWEEKKDQINKLIDSDDFRNQEIPKWNNILETDINELFTNDKYEPTGIYLVSACRSFVNKSMLTCDENSTELTRVSIPRDENNHIYKLLSELEVYEQVVDGNYYQSVLFN